MDATRRPRASRALLALVFVLALLGPGAAGRASAAAEATGSLGAGPALPGLLAATIAAAWTLVPGRRAGRAAGHRAAAGARAPPPQLASV
jgi:hypothetical protein